MKKQAIIEECFSLAGIAVSALYFAFHQTMDERWVYLPSILLGVAWIVMWFRRKDFKQPEGFEPYWRRTNMASAIGGLILAVIIYFAAKEAPEISSGVWVNFVAMGFILAHGSSLNYLYHRYLRATGKK
ncbi:MAG: hypothetical protein J5526_06490 [Bacteroidales bacterium]|nr:hypothetical protein [Bacteroidales bacterium]